MELEEAVLERVGTWESLSRWEKSELGKDLRRQGLSYGEIMDLIPVKKSTLATWCREVDLTQKQIESIKKRRAQIPGLPRDTNWRRREEIQELRVIARDLVPELATDPFWVAGLVLYWAEGAKSRNFVSMANTDPRALRLFVRWVLTFIDPAARFSLHLHLHEGNDDAAAQAFWREETRLSNANFHKTFIKPKGTGHRKNHLAHGICTVRLRRAADPWNIIMEWIDTLAYHFELDKPDR
ncbi:MAG: hypothetical protein ACC742_16600 [Thermoanaerobaculales bacterium]